MYGKLAVFLFFQGGSIPGYSPSSFITKSQHQQSVVTRPTSCTSQISTSVTPGGVVPVSANYYREIRDHDYCSNVHQKSGLLVSQKPAVQLLSSNFSVKEQQVNPEGSMLKSLLINSELMEKMKQETLERRTSSSSCKSLEDVVPTENGIADATDKANSKEKNSPLKKTYTVELEAKNGVDFEKLIDVNMNKANVKKDMKNTNSLETENSGISKVSIVTVTKNPNTSANTQKKTFTLDELIAKDMKRKALEKAQLEAILKTTPRSNPNTPKSSPYQSPRKNDSPKLPELPELRLNQPLKRKPLSKNSSKESSPKVSPAKRSIAKPKVASAMPSKENTKKAKDAKPVTKEGPKPQEIPSRQRTESKCLDVVDMEVDNSEIVHNIEVSSADEIKKKQFGAAREIVTKVSELVTVIVKNTPCVDSENTKRAVPTAATYTTAESEMCQNVPTKEENGTEIVQEIDSQKITADHTAKTEEKMKSEGDKCLSDKEGEIHEPDGEDVKNVQTLTEDVEEELYETAMDIEIQPDDDYFHDDDDNSYQFEPVDKLGDMTTDLNDNTPLQPNMAFAVGAPEMIPLFRDPLGLESAGIVNIYTEQEEGNNCNQQNTKSVATEVKKSGRNYRKRDANERTSPEQEPTVFDKLPNYCRLLTIPNKYPQKGEIKASKLVDSSIPDRDRDPSPDRSDPMYNKVPSYVSHFTNSTKYDGNYEEGASLNSSRSQTPNLVIASRAGSTSRPTSRPVSRESTPPRAYKNARSSSSSSSCSTCSSNSSDFCPSRSRSGSRRRSFRRSRDSRHRRRTCSSRSRGSRHSR